HPRAGPGPPLPPRGQAAHAAGRRLPEPGCAGELPGDQPHRAGGRGAEPARCAPRGVHSQPADADRDRTQRVRRDRPAMVTRLLAAAAGRRIGPAWIAMALLLLALPGHAMAGSTDAPPNEYEVKAAFLYNFAKFVEW